MQAPVGLLFRKLTILAIPVAALLVLYAVLDPFQVVRHGTTYAMRGGVAPNRDVMNTELLLRQKDVVPYDAFVFGNSRSLAFHARDWSEWVAPATPFHFDAAAESLLGLRGKLRLLERENIRLRHALIVLDHDLLGQTLDTTDIVTIKHPAISGGSALRFQLAFLKAFFLDLFPLKYFDYRLFRTYRPYMAGVIDPRVFTTDPETNDSYFTQTDNEIASQPELFYAPSRWQGADRTPRDAPRVIDEPQLRMLQDIRSALERARTDYQIVVSPDFRRIRLNPADLAILQNVFGADRVFDFSRDPILGLDIRDWYETAHYRPHVAREIMRRIYQHPPTGSDVAR